MTASADQRPMPDLPGDLTLDQAHAILYAFGYQFAIIPSDPPRSKPGFRTEETK